jgi:chromosome segregation ATPase
MSDTPETDAEHAQFPMGGFTLDFARKLERERDRLAAIARELTEALSDLEFRRDLFKLQEQQLNDVRAERDRMAEEINEINGEYGLWWAQKRIAIDERDEAREQRDRMAEGLNDLWHHYSLTGAAYELIEKALAAVKG